MKQGRKGTARAIERGRTSNPEKADGRAGREETGKGEEHKRRRSGGTRRDRSGGGKNTQSERERG